MTGLVLFGSVLALLLTVIIWSAIRSGDDTGADLDPRERRDAAIEALRTLEFEFGTGKLSEEEYESIRGPLRREALAARDGVAEGFCPDCGRGLGGAEEFCPGCGRRRVSEDPGV